MRRAASVVALFALSGCEWILGISDPSLVTREDASSPVDASEVIDAPLGPPAFVCDLVNQTNCAIPSDACYYDFQQVGSFCRSVPSISMGATQGQFCAGGVMPCGNDSCDKGYVPLGQFSPTEMRDRCAFFCSPVPTHSGAPNDDTGDPNGVRCSAEFGGARPDGPGSGFQCRFVNSLHADLSMLPPAIGMCVDVEQFGDCRMCDLSSKGACAPGCLPANPP